MSDGAVQHIGCGGRFDIKAGPNGWPEDGYKCRVCSYRWDGRTRGVAEWARCQATESTVEIDEYELTAETKSEKRCSKYVVGNGDWCEEHEHEWKRP